MAGFNIGDKLTLQGGSSIDSEYSSVSDLFNNIIPNVYIIAGVIIFFMIIIGGFMIVSNASSADKNNNAKQIITSAIIGLLVVFASYWIIQIIQVVTGIQITNSNL